MRNDDEMHEIPEGQFRHHDVAYDRTDLGSRKIFIVLIGFALFIGVIHIVGWGILRYVGNFRLTGRPSGPVNIARMAVVPKGDPALRFPEPVLQPDPVADLNKFRATENEVLNEYGWVDQQKGIVRIPISRAIALTAERGLPTRPNAGVPGSTSFGGAPSKGGGTVPLPANSPARVGASAGGASAPTSPGARQQQSQQSGSQAQTPGRRQERQ